MSELPPLPEPFGSLYVEGDEEGIDFRIKDGFTSEQMLAIRQAAYEVGKRDASAEGQAGMSTAWPASQEPKLREALVKVYAAAEKEGWSLLRYSLTVDATVAAFGYLRAALAEQAPKPERKIECPKCGHQAQHHLGMLRRCPPDMPPRSPSQPKQAPKPEPQDLRDAQEQLADLVQQIHAFAEVQGEADFETGRAMALLRRQRPDDYRALLTKPRPEPKESP